MNHSKEGFNKGRQSTITKEKNYNENEILKKLLKKNGKFRKRKQAIEK
jgi:hypothetical protein